MRSVCMTLCCQLKYYYYYYFNNLQHKAIHFGIQVYHMIRVKILKLIATLTSLEMMPMSNLRMAIITPITFFLPLGDQPC